MVEFKSRELLWEQNGPNQFSLHCHKSCSHNHSHYLNKVIETKCMKILSKCLNIS